MGLAKSKGNMYGWVTHMHTHLAGECSHRCSYCYVQTGPAQMSGKYKGPLRLIEKELMVDYGSGKTIFIEHMNDLFADHVPDKFIDAILGHARSYPRNTYVFQTKNTLRANHGFMGYFPPDFMMGTTAETNRSVASISKAPHPEERLIELRSFSSQGIRAFITIEPIMDFDLGPFVKLIREAMPSFVNIGADSKRCGLPEPDAVKVKCLIGALNGAGIEIRKKHNLERLMK